MSITGCEKWKHRTILYDWQGLVESQNYEIVSDIKGLNIRLTVYDDYSCTLETAILKFGNSLVNIVDAHYTAKISSEAPEEIVISDSSSGEVIAKGQFLYTENGFRRGEILLAWEGSICATWDQYKEICEWESTCIMSIVFSDFDDIVW